VDNYWNLDGELNQLRDRHEFFKQSFDFIDTRHIVVDDDQLFDNGRDLSEFLLHLNNWLSDFDLNFLNSFLIVRHDLFNLF
jgi:hypothetical protein